MVVRPGDRAALRADLANCRGGPDLPSGFQMARRFDTIPGLAKILYPTQRTSARRTLTPLPLRKHHSPTSKPFRLAVANRAAAGRRPIAHSENFRWQRAEETDRSIPQRAPRED